MIDGRCDLFSSSERRALSSRITQSAHQSCARSFFFLSGVLRFRKSRKKKRRYIYNNTKRPERAAQKKKTLGHAKRKRRRSVVAAHENSIELCSTCIVSVLNKKSKSVRRTRERTSDRWFLRYGCFAASVFHFLDASSNDFSNHFPFFLSFFLSFSLLSFSLSLSLSLSFSLLALSRASFGVSFLNLFMRCYCVIASVLVLFSLKK